MVSDRYAKVIYVPIESVNQFHYGHHSLKEILKKSIEAIKTLPAFSEGTVRIQTLGAILTQPTMTNESKFCLPYVFSGQDTRQDQVQNRHAVVQAAGGNAQQRDTTNIGYQKHGSRECRSAIVNLCRTSHSYAFSRYIIGIYTHTATQQQYVAAVFNMV